MILGFCMALFVASLFSCTNEEWTPFRSETNKAFTVKEAKDYFQKNILTVKQLNLGSPQSCCSDPAHHSPTTKTDGDRCALTPDWSRAI